VEDRCGSTGSRSAWSSAWTDRRLTEVSCILTATSRLYLVSGRLDVVLDDGDLEHVGAARRHEVGAG
jgi:hypothetical protein